jgi:hypothetical protein
MIRRTLAVGALAAIALATPTAALATDYPAQEDSLTCADAQIAPGASTTCEGAGPEGADAALQATTSGANASIAGTVTSDTKTISGGSASFTVTAPAEEGTIGITLLIDGEAVDTTSILVAEELSSTGFENTGLAVGAAVLLVAGAGAVVIGARRRSQQNA